MNVQVESKTSNKQLGRIIDCDVHPYVKGGMESVFPYMPKAWKERFVRKRANVGAESRALKYLHPNGSAVRSDAAPPSGGPAGSDADYLIKDLLDGHGIDAAILNCLQTATICAALGSIDESVVLASAFNDFFADQWLPKDKRLKFAIAVPSQDPEAAAAEIHRFRDNPQVVAISLPLMNILLGNKRWWPIYAAAQEVGRPILLHVSGTEGSYHGAPMSAGGVPDSYAERYVTLSQAGEANVNSLIFSGTLEKFPDLNFAVVEYGFLWVLPLSMRMDRIWRQLRHETPWVRKSPIDYLHERFKFATQQIEEPRSPKDMETLISMLGADLLCFSTDYPHWDNDMPLASLRQLSPDARRMIFSENAAKLFRL
jgi:predicted TIM-barrel fold metal-dependent hydrolase